MTNKLKKNMDIYLSDTELMKEIMDRYNETKDAKITASLYKKLYNVSEREGNYLFKYKCLSCDAAIMSFPCKFCQPVEAEPTLILEPASFGDVVFEKVFWDLPIFIGASVLLAPIVYTLGMLFVGIYKDICSQGLW